MLDMYETKYRAAVGQKPAGNYRRVRPGIAEKPAFSP
jgi:hypothetical protein